MKKEALKKGAFPLNFKILITGFTFLLLTGLISCNSKKNKAPKDEADALLINDATYYVKLKATDLQTIFAFGSGNEVKQILFDFDVVDKNYSLTVYGTDQHGNAKSNSFKLDVITTKNPVKNIKKLKRRPQVITRGELKAFLGLTTGTDMPIPGNQFKDMYFMASTDQDPRNPGQNLMYLFYSNNMNTYLTTAAVGSGATKPSPPATPCENGCDQ